MILSLRRITLTLFIIASLSFALSIFFSPGSFCISDANCAASLLTFDLSSEIALSTPAYPEGDSLPFALIIEVIERVSLQVLVSALLIFFLLELIHRKQTPRLAAR